MGPRSSFGWAFGPLERAQDVQFNIVMEKYWPVKENFVFESYGFGEIFERQPNAFFLPRPEVESGRRDAQGWSRLVTFSQIPSHIFKPLAFSTVTVIFILSMFWVFTDWILEQIEIQEASIL